MTTVNAFGAVDSKAPLQALTIQRRGLKAHDVHVEIMYCGVCHSDIHTVRNEWSGNTKYPVVPGHEI
ncbi:MAG: alcohol dehydrogenase catalytic domain-containing protein, partial [Chitinophagaceae bacterium]|nr:alcohol dehydrogenase catalytic domain-containing protein [Chitinophagaceae bacterium]